MSFLNELKVSLENTVVPVTSNVNEVNLHEQELNVMALESEVMTSIERFNSTVTTLESFESIVENTSPIQRKGVRSMALIGLGLEDLDVYSSYSLEDDKEETKTEEVPKEEAKESNDVKESDSDSKEESEKKDKGLIRKAWDKLVAFFRYIWKKITGWVTGLWDWITGLFKKNEEKIEQIKDAPKEAKDKASELAEEMVKKAPDEPVKEEGEGNSSSGDDKKESSGTPEKVADIFDEKYTKGEIDKMWKIIFKCHKEDNYGRVFVHEWVNKFKGTHFVSNFIGERLWFTDNTEKVESPNQGIFLPEGIKGSSVMTQLKQRHNGQVPKHFECIAINNNKLNKNQPDMKEFIKKHIYNTEETKKSLKVISGTLVTIKGLVKEKEKKVLDILDKQTEKDPEKAKKIKSNGADATLIIGGFLKVLSSFAKLETFTLDNLASFFKQHEVKSFEKGMTSDEPVKI